MSTHLRVTEKEMQLDQTVNLRYAIIAKDFGVEDAAGDFEVEARSVTIS